MLKRLRAEIGLVVIIIVLGAALGIAYNQMLPRPIPWWEGGAAEVVPPPAGNESATAPPERKHGKVTTVTLDEAIDLWQEDRAVFLDSRPLAAYAAGHIPGALPVPYNHVEEYFKRYCCDLNRHGDRVIVTYCDGGECETSKMLADYLFYQEGFSDVRVFFGGWPEWVESNYPIETSEGTTMGGGS